MESKVASYLKNFLTEIEEYHLSEEEQKVVSRDKIAFILAKLERKKFRRFMTKKTEEDLKRKISKFVIENKPIHFTIPFGGYKHYWNPAHPEPDWAELFNFRFLTDYLQPILAAYEPGVIIEYISEDLIIPWMNNYSPENTKQYWKVFIELIEWYGKFLPKNLKFAAFRIGDRFDKDAIIEDVKSVVPERIKAFHKLSEEEKSKELKRSMRSIKWDGLKDLTSLSETEKMDKIIESRVVELAYYETEAKPEFLGNYLWDNISLFFSGGTSHDNVFEDLTIKSNYGSVVDYWIGRGILKHRNGKFMPTTISKKQYEEDKNCIEKVTINPQFVPFKNFESIDVFNELN